MGNYAGKLCIECRTKQVANNAVSSRFCGAACRRKFNNRRAVRGALVYDAMMASFEGAGRSDEVKGFKASLAELMAKWHAEDVKAGRTITTQSIWEIGYALRDAGISAVDTREVRDDWKKLGRPARGRG